MTELEQILVELEAISNKLHSIKVRLYGERNYLGDIPTILKHLETLNGCVHNNETQVIKNKERLRLLYIILIILLGGSGTSGLLKLLEMW